MLTNLNTSLLKWSKEPSSCHIVQSTKMMNDGR